MADLNEKWKDNVKGKMFVDQTCIACDACVLTAPENFAMHEEDGHAYVKKQPQSPETHRHYYSVVETVLSRRPLRFEFFNAFSIIDRHHFIGAVYG
jgi:ferredoxin